ncbi:MAG: CDP-archaeol synthase [Candidatus Andersenbacteria bacterium]|nr:CDP-archaeol synthase [Candidatus Andersenbacteria bacterium]MBI3250641.1 CDP-archaeol synthase [Candidatus Andersenbacteria bacterium]
MTHAILEVLLLLLPAGVANTMPIFAARYNWLPGLNKPIDGGRGIVGDNKTVRGLIIGLLFGSIAGYIISLFDVYIYESSVFSLTLGALLGAGAIGGDMIKSFFKRRLRISSGKPWRPFDQIDYVIGALIVALFFVSLTWQQVMFAIILFGALSFGVSYIGYTLNIKKSI